MFSFIVDVAFNVRASSNVVVNTGDIIKFTDVMTNIGNAYDPVSGKFIAPFNGTYEFTLILLSGQAGYAATVEVRSNSNWRPAYRDTGSTFKVNL